MNEESIVEYFSGHEGYKCGYCKSENTSYSYGMWVHTLSPLNYQNLIDRGWRRSGKYCYKPTMHVTCCPQYTIRCEALKFVLSKSQKKTLKKVNRYLINGEKGKDSVSSLSEANDQIMDSPAIETMDLEVIKNIKWKSELIQQRLETSDIDLVQPNQQRGSLEVQKDSMSDVCSGDSSPLNVSSSCLMSLDVSHQKGIDIKSNSDRPLCQKAKLIRRERKLKKLLSKGIPPEEALSSIKKSSCEPKTIENFLSECLNSNPMYKLELRLVPSTVGNPLFMQTFQESYSVYKKYQMVIHKDPPEKCSENQFVRFLVKNPFQLRLVPIDFDCEDFKSTFDESYNLFKKYQIKVHNDSEEDCQLATFEDFLIETPFKRLDGVSFSETSIYGSFHQQYWLNNKLIAVGVLDILPFCISSVYFYYDPDYSFLSLGTYASLREIAFTRELNKTHPDIKYYYLGFYIHSCTKMRYKGQYYPSFLLCPETCIYQPIDKCKAKLDVSKYHRLEEDPLKEDVNGVVNLSEVLILYKHKQMTYPSYRKLNKNANDQELVEEYGKFVGRKCYQRMMLFRSS